MATRHYIADQLRRLDPVDSLGMSDDDLIEIANRCSCCGEQVFSDDEIDEFAARSETYQDFLHLILFSHPQQERKTYDPSPGYDGSQFDD